MEDEVARQSPVELGYGFVAFKVEVFVFEEAFNEDVVHGTAASCSSYGIGREQSHAAMTMLGVIAGEVRMKIATFDLVIGEPHGL